MGKRGGVRIGAQIMGVVQALHYVGRMAMRPTGGCLHTAKFYKVGRLGRKVGMGCMVGRCEAGAQDGQGMGRMGCMGRSCLGLLLQRLMFITRFARCGVGHA